jgi:hypothetical protein
MDGNTKKSSTPTNPAPGWGESSTHSGKDLNGPGSLSLTLDEELSEHLADRVFDLISQFGNDLGVTMAQALIADTKKRLALQTSQRKSAGGRDASKDVNAARRIVADAKGNSKTKNKSKSKKSRPSPQRKSKVKRKNGKDRKRSERKSRKGTRGKQPRDRKTRGRNKVSSPSTEVQWSTLKRDLMQLTSIPKGQTGKLLDLIFGLGDYSPEGTSEYRMGTEARATMLRRKLHEAARLYLVKNWKNDTFEQYRASIGLHGWSATRKAKPGTGLPEGRTAPELSPGWLGVLSRHLEERRLHDHLRSQEAAARRSEAEAWLTGSPSASASVSGAETVNSEPALPKRVRKEREVSGAKLPEPVPSSASQAADGAAASVRPTWSDDATVTVPNLTRSGQPRIPNPWEGNATAEKFGKDLKIRM